MALSLVRNMGDDPMLVGIRLGVVVFMVALGRWCTVEVRLEGAAFVARDAMLIVASMLLTITDGLPYALAALDSLG